MAIYYFFTENIQIKNYTLCYFPSKKQMIKQKTRSLRKTPGANYVSRHIYVIRIKKHKMNYNIPPQTLIT